MKNRKNRNRTKSRFLNHIGTKRNNLLSPVQTQTPNETRRAPTVITEFEENKRVANSFSTV